MGDVELVDAYNIECKPVRDVLVRYLDERRPALDYNSFTCLVGKVVGTFWADLERHHPMAGFYSWGVPRGWPLAGWSEELSRISELTRRRDGPVGVVLAGPAGVGKTRLAREALGVCCVDG